MLPWDAALVFLSNSIVPLLPQILFDGKRAVGVEFIRNGTVQRAQAHREVLVSAGAIRSPHLLLLSGIGPRAQLQKLKVALFRSS